MISLSTRFFGQPRLIIPTRGRRTRSGPDIGAESNRSGEGMIPRPADGPGTAGTSGTPGTRGLATRFYVPGVPDVPGVPAVPAAFGPLHLRRLQPLLLDLGGHQAGVDAALVDELVVTALLDEAALVHHQDQVGVADGGEAVGDDDAGGAQAL